MREGDAPLRKLAAFSLKVYVMPLALYSYPINSGVPPRGSGIVRWVREEVEESGGKEDEALELSFPSLSRFDSDEELDIDIMAVLKGVVRGNVYFTASFLLWKLRDKYVLAL
jgi:hypothetical protein